MKTAAILLGVVVVAVLWFVFLTCLAPIAIPLYFLVRARRGGQTAAAG